MHEIQKSAVLVILVKSESGLGMTLQGNQTSVLRTANMCLRFLHVSRIEFGYEGYRSFSLNMLVVSD